MSKETDLKSLFNKVFGAKPQESEKELFRKLGSIPLNKTRIESKRLIKLGLKQNLITPCRKIGLKTVSYRFGE